MLGDEVDFAYEAVFDKEGFCETDAGVEVEVGERHGVFEDVPECFLRVEEEEVGAEGERGFGETLSERCRNTVNILKNIDTFTYIFLFYRSHIVPRFKRRYAS